MCLGEGGVKDSKWGMREEFTSTAEVRKKKKQIRQQQNIRLKWAMIHASDALIRIKRTSVFPKHIEKGRKISKLGILLLQHKAFLIQSSFCNIPQNMQYCAVQTAGCGSMPDCYHS